MAATGPSATLRIQGYPKAVEGPKTSYKDVPGSNPVLRGIPLVLAGSAVATVSPLSNFLWSNAGFGSLKKLKDLEHYDPRYDPTVVPIQNESSDDTNQVDNLVPPYRGTESVEGRHISAGDYVVAFETGKVTPTGVAIAILELLETTPKHKVAFLSIVKEQVLKAAELSTQRYKEGKTLGPLDGVPLGVKDEVDLSGYKKTFGSSVDFTDPRDITSWCVQKWQDAGAVIIGKLNMHELGLDTTNNNPVSGTPLNPYNPKYYTGGSSGGSAYAVASGLLPIALGVDGGGSIRIPAAYCGIYGLKPSHGRISRFPTRSIADSCSVAGPMASNMADLELAYRVMAAPDPNDQKSARFPVPRPENTTYPKVLGIYKPWFDNSDPSVLAACNAALARYKSLGYSIIDIHLPYLHEGQLAHAMTILAEISLGMPSLSGLTAGNKILLAIGSHTPASDFLRAQQTREMLMQHLTFLFRLHPGLLIVTPTTPNAGWHITHGAADLKHGISDANMSLRSMTFVWMANFTGCPALTIPVGTVEGVKGGKVPVGLMAMGEWGSEDELMEWGREGEEFAWGGEGRKMERPENWVDVLGLVGKR